MGPRAIENPLHPTVPRLELDDPPLTAEALDAQLAAHPNRGFTCLVDQKDHATRRLLEAPAFKSVRQTVEGVARPIGGVAPVLPDGFHAGTLQERPDLLDEWVMIHYAHYAATHRANPATGPKALDWKQVFIGADYIPDAAFFIGDRQNLLAFSCLRKNPDGGYQLAWFGTTPAPQGKRAFRMLNMALLMMEQAYMRANRIPAVIYELDSTSPDARWHLRQMPLEQPQTWLTFVLQP